MAVVCNYSVAVCEAVFALSVCGELILKTALVLIHILATCLSVLLKLNTFLKVTLAGVIFSRGDSDQRDCANCSTWPSAENSDSCSLLCRKKRAIQRLQSLQTALHVLPAIYQHLLHVSVTILPVLHVALPVLFNNIRSFFSTILALLDYSGTPSVFHILGLMCNMRAKTAKSAFQL